jgi:hypothetical protein
MRPTRCVMLAVLVALTLAAGRDSWRDTPMTTQLWNVISSGNVEELRGILETDETAAKVRSADGRGPLWWAHEYNQPEMVKMLLNAGADPADTDGDGKKPSEVTNIGPTEYMSRQVEEPVEEPINYDNSDDDDDDE